MLLGPSPRLREVGLFLSFFRPDKTKIDVSLSRGLKRRPPPLLSFKEIHPTSFSPSPPRALVGYCGAKERRIKEGQRGEQKGVD